MLLLCPQPLISRQESRSYCCMFYNVENLFHPSVDTLSEDDEDFTPGGARRWTFYRYNRKVAEICKVILAVNGWEPPEIICFSEIENRKVLADIATHPLLLNFHYEILHRDSPDHRGIDVGILYRSSLARCIDTTWIGFSNSSGTPMHTREILAATFALDTDTVLVAANHWTSKYGGAMETEHKRILQAETLDRFIGDALTGRPDLLVIAGGDLNDATGSRPLESVGRESGLSEVLPPADQRTYKYQGKWNSVDHVFTGGRLAASSCRAEVPVLPFLLERDEKHTGMRPRRTYRGFAYSGGISDHLPLLVYFRIP